MGIHIYLLFFKRTFSDIKEFILNVRLWQEKFFGNLLELRATDFNLYLPSSAKLNEWCCRNFLKRWPTSLRGALYQRFIAARCSSRLRRSRHSSFCTVYKGHCIPFKALYPIQGGSVFSAQTFVSHQV